MHLHIIFSLLNQLKLSDLVIQRLISKGLWQKNSLTPVQYFIFATFLQLLHI